MSETIAAANSRQVGGDHYRTEGVQHWDLMKHYGIPYLLGCASKYVSRHHAKAGRQDLEKAIHYLEKWVESPSPKHLQSVGAGDLLSWCSAASLPAAEVEILMHMLCWPNAQTALDLTRKLIERRYPPSTISLRGITEYVYVPEQPDWAHVIVGPGTPEDGGHHARQPQEDTGDSGDETEAEVIRRYDVGDILAGTLPESLSHHEWQHHCSEKVQEQYGWDVSAARFLYLKRIRAT